MAHRTRTAGVRKPSVTVSRQSRQSSSSIWRVVGLVDLNGSSATMASLDCLGARLVKFDRFNLRDMRNAMLFLFRV